ncbi:MAG: peptidoglycan DD-metalloendopeptidase family protein [Sutterellaceae bacterium]|nr:peptidoglycan DD-metalloendopeptidase family protein [Sutterellaceae bacterium]
MKLKTLAAVAAMGVLAGCSSVDLMAPVEDRSTKMPETSVPIEGSEATAVPVPSEGQARHLVAETRAVSSGRKHVVAEGDTIWNISVRYGCNPRELMQLNGITDPTLLSLGRELDIPEAKSDGRVVRQAPIQDQSTAESSVAEGQVIAPVVEVAKRPETPEEVANRQLAEQKAKREAAERGEIEIRWPVRGYVMRKFEETGNLGIDIGASKGESVMAVLDGTVQYVGNNNADGYGQFVIVRHNIRLPGKSSTPLVTVYGNASKILVKPGESIRAGQKIAEVGDSGANETKLRFEIRQGTPLDPMLYLKQQ